LSGPNGERPVPLPGLRPPLPPQARFTSDASRELRTSLSVILSQTQTALARERSSSEYREALEAGSEFTVKLPAA